MMIEQIVILQQQYIGMEGETLVETRGIGVANIDLMLLEGLELPVV